MLVHRISWGLLAPERETKFTFGPSNDIAIPPFIRIVHLVIIGICWSHPLLH